ICYDAAVIIEKNPAWSVNYSPSYEEIYLSMARLASMSNLPRVITELECRRWDDSSFNKKLQVVTSGETEDG
ncbi:MAG: hypothetical protein JSW41_04915, partial [Candidatus Aenigmatarchaeota archaeon]